MKDKLYLYKTPWGDKAYSYDKSIVVFFSGKRKVLSTSLYNGGYHEDFLYVFNHDATQGAGMPCKMLANTYAKHMELVANELGLNSSKATGMGTAAQMKNVSIKSHFFRELEVTAIVTGGIETNGGRAGDPATFYKPLEKDLKPGTINIILLLSCDLPESIMARALVTCTEAKIAAIEELMAGSNYSTGLATGSGTDQTIIVANSESNILLEGAGKHSKLGELIGLSVKDAVKEALDKQTGLNPINQHNLLARLKRFGVTHDTIWEEYKNNFTSGEDILIKPEFLSCLNYLATDSKFFPLFIAIIHIYDEYLWQLLEEEETTKSINALSDVIGKEREISEPFSMKSPSLEDFRRFFNCLLSKLVKTY